MPDTAVIDEALAELREMLASDDYVVNWDLAGDGRVNVEVAAGSESCADCLVPAAVLEAILRGALAETPYELAEIRLPESAEH